jgi:tRNA A-37 threonylcarbamoyl transferase component Bud32/TolB-like protein
MDAERARKVEALYESALKAESDRRAAYLAENCGGDESLRLEVESLLQHNEDAGRFLAIPALEVLAEKVRLSAGERVSHYEIQEKLGEGGMGVVYQARDTRLGRRAALKFVKVQFGERWEREARAIAALNHPHIATLYDVGQYEGTPYLVMEYVAGRTLGKLIPPHGMRLNEALKIAIQVAGALTCAHSAGIIHRDLKPANLMVDEAGQVKVLDFGLAKLTDKARAEDVIPDVGSQTGEDTIVGTPAYMSPEQVEGKPADARSDIFSFGSLLYELVTGRPAFKADSKASMMAAVLDREPEPISPELPAELAKVISKCLRKDPERRFQHIDDVKGALEDLLEEVQAGKRTDTAAAPKAWRRWWPAMVGAAILLAVLLLPLNVGGLRDRLLARRAAPTPDPKRVAVAIFENRTGDASLDNFGKMAAESVSEGLLQIPTIQVVPSTTVFELPPSATKSRALAKATGAGTIISGNLYLQGGMLQVQAAIMEMAANQPLYAIEPAEGKREKAMEIVGRVRQRVLDAVAARYLNPLFNLLVEETKPPPFVAQREFAEGCELFESDLAAAAAYFKRASEMDNEFVLPGIELSITINNQGKLQESAAELDRVERTHLQLTTAARRRIDWTRANLAGRLEEQYSMARDIVKLEPGSAWDACNLAFSASMANRPREASEAFQTGCSEGFQPSHTFYVYMLMYWTGNLHLLGEHEKELQIARRAQGAYPHILNVRAFEARALAAQGRTEEVKKVVEEILTIPSKWAFTTCCLPHATPAYVMLAAAEELRAHDRREDSLKMADRAVDWYRSRVGDEAKQEDARSGLGDSFYLAEQWEEARGVFTRLAAEHPDNIYYQGRVGTLAARRGDRATAERIAGELQRLKNPDLYGDQTSRSARIFALLGDRKRAVALLREAVAQGAGMGNAPDVNGYGLVFRHAMDLEPLHGYPPFEELIKPKD